MNEPMSLVALLMPGNRSRARMRRFTTRSPRKSRPPPLGAKSSVPNGRLGNSSTAMVEGECFVQLKRRQHAPAARAFDYTGRAESVELRRGDSGAAVVRTKALIRIDADDLPIALARLQQSGIGRLCAPIQPL